MKNKVLIFLYILLFSVSGIVAQPRFFKAHRDSVKYVYTYQESRDPVIGHSTMWLGNDTIVDGYSCVELWNQDEGGAPECVGAIREDENGYVWRTGTTPHVDRRKLKTFPRWMFLYDFSRSDWEKGDSLEMNTCEHTYIPGCEDHESVMIWEVSSMPLLNGEVVPIANVSSILLAYGLGYLAWYHPFEGLQVMLTYMTGGDILEYWRDGQLLYKADDRWTSVDNLSLDSAEPVYYDLQGRPVAHPTSGIYIQDGRKVLMREK